MTDTTPEEIQSEAKNELAEIELTKRNAFPVRYFAKKSPATRKLIERSDGTIEMRADNRWYSAYFEEPQFVSVMRVFHKNFSANPNFNFAFLRHSDGAAIRVSKDNILHKKDDQERHYIEVNIFQLIHDVSFEPPKRWGKARVITGVDIFGYDRESFEKTVQDTFNVFTLKNRTELKFKTLVEEANATMARADALKEDIKSLEQSKGDLVNSLSLQREELQSLNQTFSKVESDISVRTEVLNNLTSDIDSKKVKLLPLPEKRKT